MVDASIKKCQPDCKLLQFFFVGQIAAIALKWNRIVFRFTRLRNSEQREYSESFSILNRITRDTPCQEASDGNSIFT